MGYKKTHSYRDRDSNPWRRRIVNAEPKEKIKAKAEELEDLAYSTCDTPNRCERESVRVVIEAALTQVHNEALNGACDSLWGAYMANHETTSRFCKAIRRKLIKAEK